MKTTILLLVFSSLSIGLLAENYQSNPIEIQLSKAIKNPYLVQAMYLQLDDGFLNDEISNNASFSRDVFFNSKYYVITGTYEEWVSFFLMDIIINENRHPAVSDL